jgi:CheY-like chemotaxis protein
MTNAKNNAKAKRLLVVDNEAYIQEITKISLELIAGWEISTASSGAEAILKATAEQPDAILLDIMMPDMDGVETFRHLQAQPETQNIPVIILTAQLRSADQTHYKALGIREAIGKPFDPVSLAQQIKKTLGWV